MLTLEKYFNLNAESTDSDVKAAFDKIAKELIENCAIEYKGEKYLIKEIEFYFYNKNHKDITTHPRDCKALQWYVNDFGGIDLTFKSHIEYKKFVNRQKKEVLKPVLDDSSYFGGILIRGLQNKETNEKLERPWACSELFRVHDAFGRTCQFPVLVDCSTESKLGQSAVRHNLTRSKQKKEDKVKDILSMYGNSEELLMKENITVYTGYFDRTYAYIADDWRNDNKDLVNQKKQE